MDYQDWLEQTYLKLTTKEHRKSFAQFFTPPAIATLMAAYILDLMGACAYPIRKSGVCAGPHQINVVRNEAQIYNLTTFHSIFVLDEANTDLIFAYLLTPLAKDIIMQNRREYGGGLEKLEPLDINHAVCVNFAAMSEEQRSKILELYGQYRTQVLNAAPAATLEQAIAAISAAFMDVIKEQ